MCGKSYSYTILMCLSHNQSLPLSDTQTHISACKHMMHLSALSQVCTLSVAGGELAHANWSTGDRSNASASGPPLYDALIIEVRSQLLPCVKYALQSQAHTGERHQVLNVSCILQSTILFLFTAQEAAQAVEPAALIPLPLLKPHCKVRG